MAAAEKEVRPLRHPGGFDHCRVADVAVVEAHHAEASLGELFAKLLLPGEHLGPQPHRQQQRVALGVADLLVGDLDAVARRQAHFTEADHPAEV